MPYRARNTKKPKRSSVPVRAGEESLFLPNLEQISKIIALQGATDDEIEIICNVSKGTVKRWRKLYPSFDEAIREGRTACDAEMLWAVFKTGIGFEYSEEQAVGGREPCVMIVKRKALPSIAAQKYWLKNRQRNYWPDRNEVTGANGEPINGKPAEDRNSLIDSIVALVSCKPDGKTKPETGSEDRRR